MWEKILILLRVSQEGRAVLNLLSVKTDAMVLLMQSCILHWPVITLYKNNPTNLISAPFTKSWKLGRNKWVRKGTKIQECWSLQWISAIFSVAKYCWFSKNLPPRAEAMAINIHRRIHPEQMYLTVMFDKAVLKQIILQNAIKAI